MRHIGLILAACILISPNPVIATPSNQEITNIWQKSYDIKKSFNNINGEMYSSSHAGICFSEINQYSTDIYNLLSDLVNISMISTHMINQKDWDYVERVKLLNIKHSTQIIDINRDNVSKIMGLCPDSPIVVQKGQELIYFMSDINRILQK